MNNPPTKEEIKAQLLAAFDKVDLKQCILEFADDLYLRDCGFISIQFPEKNLQNDLAVRH